MSLEYGKLLAPPWMEILWGSPWPGSGAGWQEREHRLFGFDLLDMKGRFARFEEGLECVQRLLRSDEPVTFAGKYFQLQEAQVLPRPYRRGGPPKIGRASCRE